MTTMLSLILAFMLSIGGSPAVSVNPAGCPGDTGIQVTVDNNRNINHFFEDYREKTASRPISKKILETPLMKRPKTQIRLRFSLLLKGKLRLMGYMDSMNLYQAFGMNPVNNPDPFGLLTQGQRKKVGSQVFRLLMAPNEGRKRAALATLQSYRAEFGALTQEDIVDIFGENDSILNATYVTMQDILNLGGAKIALGMEDLSTNYNIYTRDDFMGMDALALRWNTESMIATYNSVLGNISRMNRLRKASGSMESSYSFLNPAINRRLSYIELTPGNYESILTEQMALEGQANAAAFATTSVACILVVRSNILAMQSKMGTIRVGRWMSKAEYQNMLATKRVQEGGGGLTFSSTDGPGSFMKQAPKGSVYVEYDVPADSLLPGGKAGWVKNIGPNAPKSQILMLNKKGGEMLPKVSNIELVMEKR